MVFLHHTDEEIETQGKEFSELNSYNQSVKSKPRLGNSRALALRNYIPFFFFHSLYVNLFFVGSFNSL